MSGVDRPATTGVTPDAWRPRADVTPARLGLGRAGSGQPTRAVLDFALDHARARDAVLAAPDEAALAASLAPLELDSVTVESAAPDRATYLRRPDFGRRLSRNARTLLAARPRQPCDVLLIVADGLSAAAVMAQAPRVLAALVPQLQDRGMTLGPLIIARQARVALGDEIGSIMGARLVVMLVGERPGLSAADSLGAYLTFGPKPGLTDAGRNCVSNIRDAGLTPEAAATTLFWLIERSMALGISGITLKDESPTGFCSSSNAIANSPALET